MAKKELWDLSLEQRIKPQKSKKVELPKLSLRGTDEKGKESVIDLGPGGGLGFGCGVGIGLGLTGGVGFHTMPWSSVQFVFGIGMGCGVGFGYGYGQGLGIRWDKREEKPKGHPLFRKF